MAAARHLMPVLGVATIVLTYPLHVSSYYNKYTHKQYHRHFRPEYKAQLYQSNTVPDFKRLNVNQWSTFQNKYSIYPSINNQKLSEINLNNKENPKRISSKLNQKIYLERKTESFENFVTPMKDNLPRKRYEVTTEQFEDSEPDGTPQSQDSDLTIAIDDDIETEDEQYSKHPYRHNYSVSEDSPWNSYALSHKLEGEVDIKDEGHSPVDSYGHPYQHASNLGVQTGGHRPYHHGYSYNVIHTNDAQQQLRRKKPAGRVRMQVFRGPIRSAGHRRFAQWGYYVVQPVTTAS